MNDPLAPTVTIEAQTNGMTWGSNNTFVPLIDHDRERNGDAYYAGYVVLLLSLVLLALFYRSNRGRISHL